MPLSVCWIKKILRLAAGIFLFLESSCISVKIPFLDLNRLPETDSTHSLECSGSNVQHWKFSSETEDSISPSPRSRLMDIRPELVAGDAATTSRNDHQSLPTVTTPLCGTQPSNPMSIFSKKPLTTSNVTPLTFQYLPFSESRERAHLNGIMNECQDQKLAKNEFNSRVEVPENEIGPQPQIDHEFVEQTRDEGEKGQQRTKERESQKIQNSHGGDLNVKNLELENLPEQWDCYSWAFLRLSTVENYDQKERLQNFFETYRDLNSYPDQVFGVNHESILFFISFHYKSMRKKNRDFQARGYQAEPRGFMKILVAISDKLFPPNAWCSFLGDVLNQIGKRPHPFDNGSGIKNAAIIVVNEKISEQLKSCLLNVSKVVPIVIKAIFTLFPHLQDSGKKFSNHLPDILVFTKSLWQDRKSVV